MEVVSVSKVVGTDVEALPVADLLVSDVLPTLVRMLLFVAAEDTNVGAT